MLSQFIVAMGKNAVPIHRSSDVVPLYRGVNLFKFMSQFTLVDSLKKNSYISSYIYVQNWDKMLSQFIVAGQDGVPIHLPTTNWDSYILYRRKYVQ